MISTFNTPSKGTKLTEENVKSIVMAIDPDVEIKYVEIFDKNEWCEEKKEWEPTDVSVHIKVGQTKMSLNELEQFLDDYTGIEWMVDRE